MVGPGCCYTVGGAGFVVRYDFSLSLCPSIGYFLVAWVPQNPLLLARLPLRRRIEPLASLILKMFERRPAAKLPQQLDVLEVRRDLLRSAIHDRGLPAQAEDRIHIHRPRIVETLANPVDGCVIIAPRLLVPRCGLAVDQHRECPFALADKPHRPEQARDGPLLNRYHY